MIDKQNLRINAIAAAMLMMSLGVSSAFASVAASLPVKPPAKVAPADAQTSSRIVVRYKAGTAVASDRRAKLSAVQSAVTRASLGGGNGISRAAAASVRAEYVRTLGVGADLIRLSGKLSKADMDKVVAEIAADPAVKYALVDVTLQHTDLPKAALAQPQLVPNDPLYAQYQWHLSSATGGINAPAAWDISKGKGVVVAVLDTGILPNHPDVAVNLLQGYDFISDAKKSRRPTDARVPGALDYGDWVESDNECYTGSLADASSWHGSHVAGTIAEATNNGIGMAGVAPNATLLPVRVLGKCGGYTSDIADAITWASGGTVAGVPANANPAEVINMSLGGGGTCDMLFQEAIDGAVARGTTVVVAAGNSAGNAANFSPASCANVIVVGATRITGGIASYSNYGAAVDLSGPGGGGSVDGNPGGYVWQNGYSGATTPTSGAYKYTGLGGTSMASPHVAAVAALVQSAVIAAGNAPLTPAALETLLKQTARPFPVSIPTSTPIGTGIVDAKAALAKALEVPCDPQTEQCTPPATALTNKVAVAGLTGATGNEVLYSFEAEAGAVLSFLTYGGSGNVSLYVSFDKEPSTTNYDAKSVRPGNNETVRFTAPQAGTYYVKLVGTSSYSGVSLVARQ
ncbi:S8 family peptidase [Xanthomonas translucens]|uniref:S8 family peptidase n=1 Tax=Xanthomonas campestris pv. translucens TaxID=343 RepID=UPI00071E7E5E|nr:S8 family peptidase [Xanthomonas translucens]QEN94800.1 S8 family serine peptidase [Xanthomonas translucens pv. undulosa]UJB14585.1 S8 family serine peptidase [Xanthomonas translucens pv. undulosa]